MLFVLRRAKPASAAESLSPELWQQQHDHLSRTLSHIFLTLAVVSSFALLAALSNTDAQLLASDTKIKVPLLGFDTDFKASLITLQLMLLALAAAIKFHVAYLGQLGQAPSSKRALPYFFNLTGRLASFLTWTSVSLVAPFVSLLIAYRGLPSKAGPLLVLIAATTLGLSFFPKPVRRRSFLELAVTAVQIFAVVGSIAASTNALWALASPTICDDGVSASARLFFYRALDLSHLDLTGVHLERANLRHADLQWATLDNAHLDHADLTKANLSNASLVGAYLSETTLNNSEFESANLRSAHIGSAVAFESNFAHARLDGADLSDVSFWHSDFDGSTLNGADLYAANVSAALNLDCDKLLTAKNLAYAVRSKAQLCQTPAAADMPASWAVYDYYDFYMDRVTFSKLLASVLSLDAPRAAHDVCVYFSPDWRHL